MAEIIHPSHYNWIKGIECMDVVSSISTFLWAMRSNTFGGPDIRKPKPRWMILKRPNIIFRLKLIG